MIVLGYFVDTAMPYFCSLFRSLLGKMPLTTCLFSQHVFFFFSQDTLCKFYDFQLFILEYLLSEMA